MALGPCCPQEVPDSVTGHLWGRLLMMQWGRASERSFSLHPAPLLPTAGVSGAPRGFSSYLFPVLPSCLPNWPKVRS